MRNAWRNVKPIYLFISGHFWIKTLNNICSDDDMFFLVFLFPDVFEDKSRGIFKLLDDVCKIQCQNITNFVKNIFSFWPNHSIIMMPKPTQIQQNTEFIIRHFAGDVLYDTVYTLYFVTYWLAYRPLQTIAQATTESA